MKGQAFIIASDHPDYPVVGAEVLKMAGEDFPIRNLISIQVEKVSRILAPSYRLFPDRTEQDRMASAYQTYGVSPK